MPIEKEIIISHITAVFHPTKVQLEGATVAQFGHTNKAVPLADGERTPESDIIGCSGAIGFRNLDDMDKFIKNPRQDLRITGILRGQAEPVTIEIVSCKAQSMDNTQIGAAPGPFSTQNVTFLADSWRSIRGVG